MLRDSGRLRPLGAAWLLLLWFVVPVAVALAATIDSAFSPGIIDDADDDGVFNNADDDGIFDDADDDGIVATRSSFDHKLIALLPSLPAESPPIVGGPAPAETDRPVPVAFVLFTPSRSPPLS